MDDNESFFKELQSKYPNLANVTYQNGNLTFPNGTVALNGFSLKQILTSTFNMKDTNIFYYLGYGFYRTNDEEINKIFSLFPQLVITEEEENLLKRFAQDYVIRQMLYNEEAPILSQDSIFTVEFAKRQKIIVESFKRPLITANIIASTYTEEINKKMNANNNQTSNNQSDTLEKGISLTKNKHSEPPLLAPSDNLGVGGFTTIFIIIMVTIIAGVYIAWKLMN